jgi:imidazolonepropionase-like amidohydrolase
MRRQLAPLAALLALGAAQPAMAETVAITGAQILTAGPAGTLDQGVIVIRDGRIISVGRGAPPAGARVINATGAVVTPGLFATGSLLGAVEVSSLGDELSVDNPQIGAAFDIRDGLDPASTLIPIARTGGLTSAVVLPQPAGGGFAAHEHDGEISGGRLTAGGGHEPRPNTLFAGQGAVIRLNGSEDMVVRGGVGVMVAFGDAGARAAGGARGAQVSALKAVFADVRAYAANRSAWEQGSYRELGLSRPDLEALVPLVQGRTPLIARVHRAADIRAVLKLAREEKLKLILEGAEEGWMAAAEIARAGVPVVINPITNRPDSFEILGATLENAARLHAAGVTLAFTGPEGAAHRAREIRYGAGTAVAWGLSWDAALAAVTINPARMFGVGDRTGSLEPGKDADLVIWSGDPFEPLSTPTAVYIRGRAQDMTTRQTELRDRYKDLGGPLPPAYRHR